MDQSCIRNRVSCGKDNLAFSSIVQSNLVNTSVRDLQTRSLANATYSRQNLALRNFPSGPFLNPLSQKGEINRQVGPASPDYPYGEFQCFLLCEAHVDAFRAHVCLRSSELSYILSAHASPVAWLPI